MRRVVVTGMGGICAFGSSWEEVKPKILAKQNAVRFMDEWQIEGMNTRLGAPVDNFTLPEHYTRKKMRSMGRVSKMAVRASELALEMAGLIDDPEIKNGRCGVAYGSSTGSTDAVADFAMMLNQKRIGDVNGTTYVRMMTHTAAVNIAIFFGLTGRVIPTSTACTSGSLGIGYAYEAIKNGVQDLMIAGGGEELCPSEAAVFDVLFATSQKNNDPKTTPAPFDKDRDGLVIGEGACSFVLEEYEHAKARGATIYAEIIGFATNCDATHITQPNKETIKICIAQGVKSAGLQPQDIGFISAHGTATDRGDVAESTATSEVFGANTPISSLKSYFGHTLGACGSLEAWLSIMMMRENWFNPTLNLKNPDPECGELAHIMGDIYQKEVEFIISNNFAFGGINTSLVFKRV